MDDFENSSFSFHKTPLKKDKIDQSKFNGKFNHTTICQQGLSLTSYVIFISI